MKKTTAVLLASSILITFVSCGDKDSKSTSYKKPSGEYISLLALNGKRVTAVNEGIDSMIEESREYYKDAEKLIPFKFDGSSFEMFDTRDIQFPRYFFGSFDYDNGKIKFKYEKQQVAKKDSTEMIAVDEEQTNRINKRIVEVMQNLNKTGSYFNIVGSAFHMSDKLADYAVVPLFFANFKGIQKNPDVPVYLYSVDDFICVPTYGFKLDGNYSKGKDFKITFNPLATYLDDEYSVYHTEDYEHNTTHDGQLYSDWLKERLTNSFGDLDDTKLEFSDGEWNWYNSEGELLNNGIYDESSKYKGLISMAVTDDSKKNNTEYKIMSPLWFYIDGNGKIWYPNWVKIN